MPRIVKAIKDKFTPHIYQRVSQHNHWLTIFGVSFVLISLGFACALVLLYSKVLILEDAIRVLAAK